MMRQNHNRNACGGSVRDATGYSRRGRRQTIRDGFLEEVTQIKGLKDELGETRGVEIW